MAEVHTSAVVEKSHSAPKSAESLPRALPRKMTPRDELLVWMKRKEIDTAIEENPTVLLIAGTGTGKTRAGSQIALEAIGPNGRMAVTENLRKATEESPVTIVADRNGEYPEEKVGDVIGFQNKYNRNPSDPRDMNKLKMLFCPIQSLLNKAEKDHLLSKYDLVFVDEVHKESKSNEILLATLRDIQEKRANSDHPLKIILTSATMDADKLGDYFKGAVKVEIPGINFDVDVKYHDKEVPINDLPKAAAEKVKWAIDKGDEGNILVFFSGIHQIEEAQKTLIEMKLGDDIEIRPFYGSMSKEEQNEITKKITEGGKRVVFLATNAAQESLTWPIKIVVDSCTHKHQKLDPITGRSYLDEEKAPLDHLTQRKGRVGRNDPKGGQLDKYYPLTTQFDWEGRLQHEKAEIQRTDLTTEVLTLMAAGYDPNPKSTKPNAFKYLNKPDQGHLDMAYKRLYKVGATDSDGNLTEKGLFMASLQLNMNNASLVADGFKYGALEDATALAVMLEEYPNAFDKANGLLSNLKGTEQSDLIPLVNLLKKYGKTSENDRDHLALNLGLRSDKMKDAYDLYTQIILDAGAIPPPLSTREDLRKMGGGVGLDLAIHDSFADASITGFKKRSLMVEGVGGPASVKVGKRSIFAQDRTLPAFISTSIRTIKEGGVDKKIAELNHALSIEARGIIYGQEHPRVAESQTITQSESPDTKMEPVDTNAEVPIPIEDEKKSEPTPEPPKKLPWYKKIWQKVRGWFSRLFG